MRVFIDFLGTVCTDWGVETSIREKPNITTGWPAQHHMLNVFSVTYYMCFAYPFYTHKIANSQFRD